MTDQMQHVMCVQETSKSAGQMEAVHIKVRSLDKPAQIQMAVERPHPKQEVPFLACVNIRVHRQRPIAMPDRQLRLSVRQACAEGQSSKVDEPQPIF